MDDNVFNVDFQNRIPKLSLDDILFSLKESLSDKGFPIGSESIRLSNFIDNQHLKIAYDTEDLKFNMDILYDSNVEKILDWEKPMCYKVNISSLKFNNYNIENFHFALRNFYSNNMKFFSYLNIVSMNSGHYG